MITFPVLLAVILILVFFTATNLIDKFIISRKAKNNYAYTFVAVSVFFVESVILSFFLDWTNIEWKSLLIPLVTGLMSGFFYIAYFYVMKMEEASQVIPLMNLQPIGLMIIHVVVLGTVFTKYQVLGIGAAVLGTIILESHHTLKTFLKSKATLIGIGYGLLVAIPIALNESAAHVIPYWNMQLPFATGALITSCVLLFRKDVRSTLAEHYKLLPYTIFSEFATIAGNVSIWYGFTLVASPILTGINTIQPLVFLGMVTLISKFYPHIIEEDTTRKTLVRKIAGTVLIVLGTSVIAVTL